ncbi:MAG TPA: glycosyltransferase family 2 protein [Rudaea sp.]
MNGEQVRIDVCICAFARRAELRRCLNSLAGQVGAPPFRVWVADNHAQPTVTAWLAVDRAALPFELQVVHAPQSNIAIARNALLQAAQAEWIAFLDDDEIAEPDWLAALYAVRDTADVIFGPVRAIYPSDAPGWLVRGDFLSKQPALRGGCTTGPSANVMFRRASVGACRFDESLGRTGGEDTLFFATLHDRGARLAFCERAVATEPADPTRSGFAALLWRHFASGHAHARVLRRRGGGRARIAIVSSAKCAASLAYALAQVGSAAGWRRQCLRAALHAGVAAHAFGAPVPVLYGNCSAAQETVAVRSDPAS